MLEMLLDKKLLFVLMGILTGLGVVDKCIVSMTMKRMVEAAGSMSKSNHPLMRLVRAKFEHACMISDTVENVGVFVDKYLYEYKVCGLRLHTLRRLEKICAGLLIVTGLVGAGLSYQVYGDGSIRTTLTYDPVEGLGDMPEFGVMFKFDADYDNVTWYGMGPEETYVDRCEGAKLGIYRNKVEDNMAKYMVPQECGNKVGVRWASVTDRKGRGMLFTGDAMEFSALPYTPHEMENAMHPFELPQVHYTVVRVSKQQMGIAGDDSWGAKPLPEYLIKTDEKMEFTFTFKGI